MKWLIGNYPAATPERADGNIVIENSNATERCFRLEGIAQGSMVRQPAVGGVIRQLIPQCGRVTYMVTPCLRVM